MAFYLGIDGGGSKTAALVTDEDGVPHGHGLAGGSNHLRVGIETATRNIVQAINIANVESGLAIRQIEYAYCGIAGSDHPEHHERVVDSLKTFFPRGNFVVDTDARIALTGAVGFGSGIVIIAGTGSVAFGRNEKGEECRAGGWGPIVGDEGSGYAIGRDGLVAILRAYDGRGAATLMTDLLCNEQDICNPADLPRYVYSASTRSDDIARIGEMVLEAAKSGDAVAQEIVDRAANDLAECVISVARRLDITHESFPVAYVGGAFETGEQLVGPMRAKILAFAPRAHLSRPLHTPVEGAAMMAIRAAHSPRPTRR
jgi:N-acetylglucosamine kinase-like BadF-type ATPase